MVEIPCRIQDKLTPEFIFKPTILTDALFFYMKPSTTSIASLLTKFLPLFFTRLLSQLPGKRSLITPASYSPPALWSLIILSNDQSHTLVIQDLVRWPFVEMFSVFLPQITSDYNFLEDGKHFSAKMAQEKNLDFIIRRSELLFWSVLSLIMILYISLNFWASFVSSEVLLWR